MANLQKVAEIFQSGPEQLTERPAEVLERIWQRSPAINRPELTLIIKLMINKTIANGSPLDTAQGATSQITKKNLIHSVNTSK